MPEKRDHKTRKQPLERDRKQKRAKKNKQEPSNRVSIHPGNPEKTRKTREFQMIGKNTGNTWEIVEHTGLFPGG